MDVKNLVSELIKQLNDLFIYNNDKLIYNNKIQQQVNELLTKIAEKTETFNKNIKKEKDNIDRNLTIIDPTTHQKISLIDVESMEERVKNVLKSNNIFSCLKSLALCNKCAHSFDGNIESIQTNFKKYYKELFGTSLNDNKLTFFHPLHVAFPELNTSNIYNLSHISDKEFNNIYDAISGNQSKVKNKTKISILRQLNIPVNVTDQSDIDNKYQEVVNNKDVLINSYLVKKYQEGIDQTELQSTMFSIKDNYISMIGQLLTRKVFQNVEYELIKTPDSKPGFEHMLVINDKDLTYYIEVHMPTVIAKSLIKEYGLVESKKRNKTISSGAPAVYYREKKEVEKIRQAIANGLISNKRASIVARNDSEESSPTNGTAYQFITNQIAAEPLGFEEFLKSKNIHTKEIIRSNRLRANENYSQPLIEQIICENYYYIYENLKEEDKITYIYNDLSSIRDGDQFDKILYKQIYKFNIGMDLMAKLLINKKNMKREYYQKNAEVFDDILIDKKQFDIDEKTNSKLRLLINKKEYFDNKKKYLNILSLIDKKDRIEKSINYYIETKIIDEINREVYLDKPKRKR